MIVDVKYTVNTNCMHTIINSYRRAVNVDQFILCIAEVMRGKTIIAIF